MSEAFWNRYIDIQLDSLEVAQEVLSEIRFQWGVFVILQYVIVGTFLFEDLSVLIMGYSWWLFYMIGPGVAKLLNFYLKKENWKSEADYDAAMAKRFEAYREYDDAHYTGYSYTDMGMERFETYEYEFEIEIFFWTFFWFYFQNKWLLPLPTLGTSYFIGYKLLFAPSAMIYRLWETVAGFRWTATLSWMPNE